MQNQYECKAKLHFSKYIQVELQIQNLVLLIPILKLSTIIMKIGIEISVIK